MNIQKVKTVIHFLCYTPRIYSALDSFTIALSSELQKKGYNSVFVFNDEIFSKVLLDDILHSGAKVEILETRRGKIRIIKELVYLLNKYRPEIVHAHFELYIKTILALLCCAYGIRFYFSNHSLQFNQEINDYQKRKSLIKVIKWRLHLRFLLFVCKKSFCVSEAVRKEYIYYCGIESKKLQTLCLGVRITKNGCPKEVLRRKLNFPLDKILVVNISAIEYVKGIDIIIKAIRLLIKKYRQNNFQAIHVGGVRSNSEINFQYDKKIKNLQKVLLGGSKYFIWLGKRNDIVNILSACDIYIHPSRVEGLPTTIMEAFSANLPAIGSKVGGIPEIIEDGKNGLLIEPENDSQLADSLNYLISNKVLRDEMGNMAFSSVKENWNLEKQVAKMIEAYEIK